MSSFLLGILTEIGDNLEGYGFLPFPWTFDDEIHQALHLLALTFGAGHANTLRSSFFLIF